MAVIKCKMCGGDLALTEGQSVAECEYCGSRQTVPAADNEKKLTLFARANRLRAACEFDKAAGIYESIVADFQEEAEAYWGLVLCKYGIEYVDDPATGKKIPTCHRSSFDSVMEDGNFEQALENADGAARKVYREEAKQLEEIRKGIISVSANEEPYDIFICYKETDENGDRTLDSVLAQDIYDALTGKGYRVFFARITLEDKLGQEYEPYIFAALNSAKVMLAVGTDYEYYNAVWVKNEWSRYLKLMEQDKSKHLIPCYKSIDAYDMPKEFAKLQAQDLGKVGAIQDLLRGIDKLLTDNGKKQQVVVSQGMSKEEKKALDALQRGQKTSRSVTLGILFALIGAFVPTPILSKLTGSVVQLLKDSYVVCIYNGQQITMADFTRNAAFAVLMIIGALLGIATALLCNWGFRSKVTSWAYLILYALVAVGLIQQKTIGVVLGPVLWWTLAVLGLCAVITTLTVYYKKKKPMIAFLVSISLLTAVIAIV